MISFRYLQINEILTYGTFRRATWAMALQGMPDHPSCTYRTRLVTEVPLPPRWAETKAIGRSACCSVCAITRLVTVKTPASTGTWNRAIHSLPPYRNAVEKQHLGCFHEKSRAETARKAGCKLQLFDLKIKTRSWCKYKIDPLIMTSWLHPPASICTECWYRYPCVVYQTQVSGASLVMPGRLEASWSTRMQEPCPSTLPVSYLIFFWECSLI